MNTCSRTEVHNFGSWIQFRPEQHIASFSVKNGTRTFNVNYISQCVTVDHWKHTSIYTCIRCSKIQALCSQFQISPRPTGIVRVRLLKSFQESIVKKIFENRSENGFSNLFQIWSIYCPTETKIEISSKNDFSDRFSKNVFLQSIHESLENVNTEGA